MKISTGTGITVNSFFLSTLFKCLREHRDVRGGGGGEPTTGMFSNLSNEGRTKVGEEGVMGSIQNI